MNHIAIFIDAENLTNWVKNNGVQSLMDELLPLGQIVVRKAYGKWSTPQLIPLQSALNENGFELVHTFHPVSGKNSTDIKMTVDTMEVALDSQVQWIVLATGDSDFSPLFRKLREQGKEVIGVGPKSPLSECVKNSCSRYIYTDDATAADEDSGDEVADAKERANLIVSEKIDSMEMLRSVLQKEDGPIALAAIKPKMLGLDNAFNEKRLGFKTFKDFVKSADFVQMTDVGGGSYLVALAEQKVAVEEDAQMVLAKALKRKGWDIVKAAFEAGFTHVTHFYNAMPGFHNKMGYKYEGTVESVYLIDDMTIECIADGIHVPPTILRMAYKIKGVERMAVITDALAVAAAPAGAKAFDERVIVEDGVAKLADRSALAGSIATSDRLVRTLVQQAEVPLEDAVRMASETPAHIMGVFDRKGALARGKDADVLILDDKLKVRCVWQMGKIIENTLF